MTSPPARPDQPRRRTVVRIGVAAALMAAVAVLFLVAVRQRREVDLQLAAHARELVELEARADAAARITDELVKQHALAALRLTHPAVEELADRAGSAELDLALLRAARGATPGAHGAVVSHPLERRGVLIVSPLPEPSGREHYHLLAREAESGTLHVLARFGTETSIPFTFPSGSALDRFEVVRGAGENVAKGGTAILVTVDETP